MKSVEPLACKASQESSLLAGGRGATTNPAGMCVEVCPGRPWFDRPILAEQAKRRTLNVGVANRQVMRHNHKAAPSVQGLLQTRRETTRSASMTEDPSEALSWRKEALQASNSCQGLALNVQALLGEYIRHDLLKGSSCAQSLLSARRATTRSASASEDVSPGDSILADWTSAGQALLPRFAHNVQACHMKVYAMPTASSCAQSLLSARRATTRSASASEDVSPGDSMPNRLTRPGTPWSAAPCTTKSAPGSPGPLILGRMPAGAVPLEAGVKQRLPAKAVPLQAGVKQQTLSAMPVEK